MNLLIFSIIIAAPIVTMPLWLPALILLIDPTFNQGTGSGTEEALEYLDDNLQVGAAVRKFREGEPNQDKRWEAAAYKQAEPYEGEVDYE